MINLTHLPIFPLPRAILFPNAVLPLHVFEPRYRKLLADCLAGARVMAMACLRGPDDPEDAFALPGGDELGGPAVRRLVGVGSIIAHEPLPDGRANILLRGIGRAQLEGEHRTELPYRTVNAIWVRDRVLEAPQAQSIRQMLGALTSQLADRLPEGGDTLRTLVASQAEAGALSDLLCAALVTQPAERLRMFETIDVVRRADGVAEAIAIALRTLGETGSPN